MKPVAPAVSVVIPTHDRLPSLQQCLDALASQSLPASAFEVIVVADGCTDGTEAAVASACHPFALRVCTQTASGAAAARNRGAREATGTLLLFVDDDVVASSGLIEAHQRVHRDRGECVAIGPYRLASPPSGDFYARILFRFWERTFDAMATNGCPQDARYVLSGNLSVPAATFRRIGGFNEVFPACGVEDYEFGLRTIEAGVPVVFAADAHARHLDTTDLARSFRRARQEGASHMILAGLRPGHVSALPRSQLDAIAPLCVVHAPRLGAWLASTAGAALRLAEFARLMPLYRVVYGALRRYWYWRGVADRIGGGAAWTLKGR